MRITVGRARVRKISIPFIFNILQGNMQVMNEAVSQEL